MSDYADNYNTDTNGVNWVKMDYVNPIMKKTELAIESLEAKNKELEYNSIEDAEILDIEFNENEILKAKVKELQAENERLGGLIHYPDCWDMAVYPKLSDALIEVGCSECYPDSE